MPTILNNGIQLPDKGSVDWYSSMQSNYNLIDTHLGDTDIHVTTEDKSRWDGKANASHTHTSSELTDIGDYATKQYVDTSISGLVDNAPAALDTLKELSTALNDDANFASTVTTALSAKANSADLATVATSGSYNDLSNKPTINDSTITIQKNGSTVDTFTTNGSNKTINIPVPTKTSDLINDSNFVDTSNSAVASGITSTKVTDYDTHIADTDIHVTSADKTTWNTVTSKADDNNVMHLSGNETAAGLKTFTDTATFSSVNIEDIRWKSLENQTIDLNDCYIPRAGAMSGYYTKDVSSGSNISNKAANTSFILISLTTRRVSASDYNIRQEFYGSGAKYIRICSNGTWTTWKKETEITADTINNLNPGALSMPSANSSNILDISAYITRLDGNANSYQALDDGWIALTVESCSGIQASITGFWGHQVVRSNVGTVRFLMPIRKNMTVDLYIFNGTLSYARFIPCQGNV